MKVTPAHERVMARVDAMNPEACWIFQGALSVGGYGVIRRSSQRGAGMAYAHRVTYEALVGPIPEGLQLDHLCRVRACVNPAHLEPVTAGENVRRSTSPIALNPGKTECPAGHPYDEENTYHYKGARQCRSCRKRRRDAWRQRNGDSDSLPSQPMHAEGGGGHA